MFAIAGLGNPGIQYAHTRHNIGFEAVDSIAESPWRTQKDCLVSRLGSYDTPIILMKPQRYMNLSGEAIRPLLSFFKIPLENLVVIHDELDLAPGRIQVRFGGSAAGHNGLKDIISLCGGPGFTRIRVGIGRPENENPRGAHSEPSSVHNCATKGRGDITNWVLGKPGPIHKELLEDAAFKAGKAALTVSREGLKEAQRVYNRG